MHKVSQGKIFWKFRLVVLMFQNYAHIVRGYSGSTPKNVLGTQLRQKMVQRKFISDQEEQFSVLNLPKKTRKKFPLC